MTPFSKLPTPCYVVDTGRLRQNLETIRKIQDRTDAKIILALKGFAMFSTFPIVSEYLCGTTASSVNEARLGREEFGGEVHAYAPAYNDLDIEELAPLVQHITFNSFSQFHRFQQRLLDLNPNVSVGLRINPEYSEVATPLYDPCRPCSRLGMTLAHFEGQDLEGVEGLHFHTMCEQNSDTLERVVEAVERQFGPFLDRMKWINFGGGHHITRSDYDVERLCRIIEAFSDRHAVQVYLEPGEAIALNAGYLVSSVLDVFENGMPLAILDASATAHMPDVLEMPYRPVIQGAGDPGSKPHTIRLGGMTCLAGDEIGDYAFDHPLKVGDRLVFEDMAHYTMVKNTTFNGVRLPSIATYDPETEKTEVVRQFGYEDYRDRLS
ncbi:MAG: carboxynorspermidine decarboxylase [Verrucomicrobia bacterium]|jgi:carboxynorspermidine decarboxylase|nr:carboxynorspermidine decarboxylase [Verrucomicrobiota bacterium]